MVTSGRQKNWLWGEEFNMDKDKLTEIQDYLKTTLKLDITFADDEKYVTERISTGMPMLDAILGGGVVRRAFMIIHGVESSGKSFITQKLIASAQKDDMVCGLIDVERSYDPVWGEKIGIDNSKLLLHQPDTAEQALDVSKAMCEGGIDILVVDSLAALLPSGEAGAGMGDWQMGLQARLINKFFRIVPPVNEQTAIILINQHRVDINGRVFHGYVPYTLPGGKGQDYFSKIMVETKRGEFMYAKGEKGKKGSAPLGFHIRAKAHKNKTHIPLLECDIPVYYTGETDFVSELFDLGIMCGIIKRGGAYYSYSDERTLGRENFLTLMRESDDLTYSIEQEVNKFIKGDDYE